MKVIELHGSYISVAFLNSQLFKIQDNPQNFDRLWIYNKPNRGEGKIHPNLTRLFANQKKKIAPRSHRIRSLPLWKIKAMETSLPSN
jgi:hypothetical protein